MYPFMGYNLCVGRIGTKQPTTAFGEWLLEEIEGRGWERKTLAIQSNVGITSVNQLVSGERSPSRDMIGRLVCALTPDRADEHLTRALLNAGLKAAGFAALDESLSEHPAISYLRRQPDPVKDRALRIMEVALPPAEAEPGEAGQQKVALVTRANNLSRDLRAGRPGLSRTPSVVWALDKKGRFLMSEGDGLPDAGLAPGQVVGLHIWDVYKDAPEFLEKVRLVLASDAPLEWSAEVRGQRYLCKTEPLRNEGGEKIGIVGTSLELAANARRGAAVA